MDSKGSDLFIGSLANTADSNSISPIKRRQGNLRHLFVYIFLFFVSLGLAFGIAFYGVTFGIAFLAVALGIPALLYSIANLKFGVVVLFSYSFFIGLNRFIKDVPLGVVIDVFMGALLLGLVLSKWKKNDYALADSAISIVTWIWIAYNFLEFFNPMASREAWIYVIRGIALLMAFYFVVLETIDDLKFVKTLLNLWIALALFGALYGLFQEFNGLSQAEKEWVARDQFRFDLIYNWGRYRIFSIFSDPALFGIMMAYTSLFCITLMPGPFKLWYKLFLAFSSGVMMLAMVYAGTRTAFAIVPAGLVFYALLTIQKRALVVCGVIGLIGAAIIFSDIRSLGPFLTTNSLERIRSAFKPSEDPSFQVRERSKAFIKPFIQSHPFGAGLGSVGIWSRRFTPNSPLAKFAPDSGYVRVAVELGWIGLIVYCIFFAVILITGIRNYYRMKNNLLKSYLAALLGVVISLVVANYPQEALIQVPTIFVFYLIMALIVKLKKLDEQDTKQKLI